MCKSDWNNTRDLCIIFITHDHYDHYSEEDIDKVINKNTTIVIPEEMITKLLKKRIDKNSILVVKPNEEYMVQGIKFDITEENRKVKCDVAFVLVGGTYTMNSKEAAQLINEIKPQVAVPIHYGIVVGTEQDAKDFIKLLNTTINCIILMK